MDNLSAFTLSLEEFGKQLPARARTFQRVVALDVLRGVVQKSPVGNPSLWKNPAPKGYVGGHFRGAWTVSAGSINESQSGVIDSSPRGTPPTGIAIAQAEAAIANAPPYSVIYVQNALPYAERLELGWSTQAPAGMVSLTLAEVRNRIQEAANA